MTGAKREKHSGQREFQMNLCKEQLNLERLLCGDRAGFSCLPSCLPLKCTVFLCLKAPATENAEISRSIYWKCSGPQASLQMAPLGMSPLGCHLTEVFTEGAVPEMRKRDAWHRQEQNHFKEKLIFFWNQKVCVWRPVWGALLLPSAVCEQVCNSQPVLTQLIGLSGYLLASGNGELGFWSPQKHKPTLTFTPVPLLGVFCWSGSKVGPRSWSRVSADLALVPTGRGTAGGVGHNWREVAGKVTATGSAASSVLQAVLGLFSSSRPSLCASLVSRTFSKGCSARTALGSFSHPGSVLLKTAFWRFVSPVLSHKT